jgi:hypothetical protein
MGGNKENTQDIWKKICTINFCLVTCEWERSLSSEVYFY